MTDVTSPSFKTRPHLTKEQRLPKYIKDAEKVIRSVKACQSNFKTVMANSRLRGQHYKKVYSLALNVLKHYDYIQTIIEKIKLPEKEHMLRREIASILIYEIIFGIGSVTGGSKPVLTILKYKDDIMHMHQEIQRSGDIKINDLNIPHYARIHTLVTTVPYVIKDLEYDGYQQILYNDDISEKEYLQLVKSLRKKTFLVDFHFKDLLVFAYNENLVQLQLYSKGHIFLQDKSSYIPVHVLNPEPGSAVLDACAAPGMKSLHLATKMENKGLLIAYEKNVQRFEILKEMLQHGAVKITKMFCKDFTLVEPNDQGYSSIDYILLDPSCSGSGMVNRMDQVTNTESSKNEERLQKLAGFQIVLLKHALKFPSVKRVVYSTCSIHEEENEYVVHEALNAFRNTFKLVPVFPEWAVRGSKDYEFGELCLRTVPEKHLTNGFFVAMFERLDDTEQCKNYEISQMKRKKGSIDKSGSFHDTKKFHETKKSDVTSESNYNREKLRSSESYESSGSKKIEVNTLSETFNTSEENNYLVSEKKKSKKRKSELQTELEDIQIIAEISASSLVNHKKKKCSKIDHDKKYLSVEKQQMKFQFQAENDFSGKYSVKDKKNNKDKHAENFNALKDENIFNISNSYHEVKNKHCPEIITDNYECLLQGTVVVDDSARKSRIPQSLFSINETVSSIECIPKKHKKNKKSKKHSHDISDICNSENLNIEYISEENIGPLENHPTKHKKHKKHSADYLNNADHGENQITGECVLEVKKKKKHKMYPADLVTEVQNSGIHMTSENQEHLKSFLAEKSVLKCKKSESEFLSESSEKHDSFVNDGHMKHKKSKKHKKHSHDSIDKSEEAVNIFVDGKVVADSVDMLTNIPCVESIPKNSETKYHIENILGSESGGKHKSKKNKHKKHTQDYFDNSQGHGNLIHTTDKNLPDVCDVQERTFPIYGTENADLTYAEKNVLGTECKIKHKHKKSKKNKKQPQDP